MMVIQKILLSVVSNFVVGLWDGLDECEISRPEILSQSAPVYNMWMLCSLKIVNRLHVCIKPFNKISILQSWTVCCNCLKYSIIPIDHNHFSPFNQISIWTSFTVHACKWFHFHKGYSDCITSHINFYISLYIYIYIYIDISYLLVSYIWIYNKATWWVIILALNSFSEAGINPDAFSGSWGVGERWERSSTDGLQALSDSRKWTFWSSQIWSCVFYVVCHINNFVWLCHQK